jgi:FeS assembly SUF system protein
VGIFSFLKGNGAKRGSEGAGSGVRPTPTPEAEATDQASSPARPDPPDPPIPPLGQGPLDQPFTPPEAWNTDALTAPRPEVAGEKPKIGPVDPGQTAALQSKVIEAIKTVYDPEIPVDIYELGLIYDVVVDADRNVLVRMTLTSPACPSAQQIPSEVRYKVKALDEVKDAWVEIEWEPPWTKDRMSEAAKLALGFF